MGYKEPTKAAREKVEDEDRGMSKIDTPSGIQEMLIINESGLYALILGSKLESAKRFKHWVTSEVLPAIRKSGIYAIVERNEYDAKATSVGEVVNLLRVVHNSMKERTCRPDDIALTIDGICNQFGIPLPPSFLAKPELTVKYEDVSDEELREYAHQLMENAYQTGRGLAVTNEEFGKFCGRKGIDSKQYKRWLLRNGYTLPDVNGKNTAMAKIFGKTMRCVMFKKKDICVEARP